MNNQYVLMFRTTRHYETIKDFFFESSDTRQSIYRLVVLTNTLLRQCMHDYSFRLDETVNKNHHVDTKIVTEVVDDVS